MPALSLALQLGSGCLDGSPGGAGSVILMESSGGILMESGDFILLEA